MKPTIAELLQQRQYNPERKPTPDQVILRIASKRVGSLQNLVTFTGKQKGGKSRYIAATIAAGITDTEIFNISLTTPRARPGIALFDTEQGDFDFYRQIEQVKNFAGLAELPPTFSAYNTREDDPISILKMLDHYLKETPGCSVVFIDGVLDLLLDFNNVVESKRLTNFIKKITKQYNILLIGVLHRGKGNDMSIGNIGSMADRLAQSVLKVEKNKERSTYQLSSEFMRSDEDFDPIDIWNNGGEWVQVPSVSDPAPATVRPLIPKPADWELSEHMTRVTEIFNEDPLLSYEGLIQAIKEVYGVGRNWAIPCIKHLKDINLVFRTGQGYTNSQQKKLYK